MVAIDIDRNRCEGKAVCLAVCPEKVFALQAPDSKALSWQARWRLRFHGGLQAFAVRPEDCSACNICAEKCPERAIRIHTEV